MTTVDNVKAAERRDPEIPGRKFPTRESFVDTHPLPTTTPFASFLLAYSDTNDDALS